MIKVEYVYQGEVIGSEVIKVNFQAGTWVSIRNETFIIERLEHNVDNGSTKYILTKKNGDYLKG